MSLNTLHVNVTPAYPIHIGPGLLRDESLLAPHLTGQVCAIVSNTTVAPLYLDTLRSTLEKLEKRVLPIVIPDGESFKTRSTFDHIHDVLLEARADRKTTLIALGGGVVGDLTGYAAATYLRGISLIQVPTTLLSQVDSSVGGKTGINHPLGKNMIGAFHQPQVVLIDTDTLSTLPSREYLAGLAEVIKYGLIRDIPFLEWIETHLEELLQRHPDELSHAILTSCRNKAEIVAVDPLEKSGVRALLNLGHTFGHAIETGMGYGVWLHGEAVAAGTILAAELSHQLGYLSNHDVDRIVTLFQRCSLPTRAPDLGLERWLSLMMGDKKNESGKLRLVLFEHMGQAKLTELSSQASLSRVLSPQTGRFIDA